MNLTKSASRFLKKNGGTILAIGASVGVVLTAIETGKATIKAEKLLELNAAEPGYTTKEKVKDCWKFYLPATALGVGTIACILGSNALNKKQIASLTAGYMALGKAYQEYRQKVIENIGIEKEAEIQDQIKEEKLPEVREKMEEEKLLCYEPISKRYFHATEVELMDAFYNLNRYFATNGYASLSDFYTYLGLEFTPESDDFGWCGDYLAEEWEYFWIDFNYIKQKTDDGLEVYYVEAFQEPIKDYLDYDPTKRSF